ncbi:MAG TPA: HPP family protein [Dehalococcoidia bacterium]|nr:HPP family protein [Dehalococcoidia bacterium]
MRIHTPHPHTPAAFERSHIRGRVRPYITQATLASLALLAILLIEQGVSDGIIVVTIASSTATVFVVPRSIASSPKRVIGGHVVSVFAGLALWSVLHLVTGGHVGGASNLQIDIFGAAAVGLSVLVMATTNTEHPPAAGTAFGIIVVGLSFTFIAFILSAAVILSIVRYLLRDKLQNLL